MSLCIKFNIYTLFSSSYLNKLYLANRIVSFSETAFIFYCFVYRIAWVNAGYRVSI